MVRSIRSRPLVAFFVLAFAITWAVWVPRAARVPVGVVGQLWTWAPAVADYVTGSVLLADGGCSLFKFDD